MTTRLPAVAVVGAGLIGGSVALSLKRAGAVVRVFEPDTSVWPALDASPLVRCVTPVEAVAGADWVVIATPVDHVLTVAEQIVPHLRRGAVLSDVASVKGDLVAALNALCPDHVSVVSLHPLAGAAASGFAAARGDLLSGATWVVCLPEDASAEAEVASPAEGDGCAGLALSASVAARALVREALALVEAGPVLAMTASRHDRVLAATSHLPQLVACALASAVAATVEPDELRLSGGGLRDTTRLAESSLSMWLPILRANADNLLGPLDALLVELRALREALAAGHDEGVQRVFVSGQSMRVALRSRA